jgi:hypothetical protein
LAGRLDHCALLFALPLDQADYEAAGRGEFLPDYSAGPLRGAPPVDWRLHEPTARDGAALASKAEARGARVYRRATLADLGQATRGSRLVILFAHQKAATYSHTDQLDPDEVRVRLAKPPLSAVVTPPATELVGDMVDALNEAVRSRRPLQLVGDDLSHAGFASEAVGEALSRDLIDEQLDGLVRAGNLVELSDGLHEPGAIAAAIDPAFVGEIDFTTCNSSVMAAVVDMRLGRTVHVFSRSAEILPGPQILLACTALDLVAEEGIDYSEARLRIERQLTPDESRGVRKWLSKLF